MSPDDIAAGDPESRRAVLGIGASAGGLEAFTWLFKTLPADTGMAFVLIQHLDPKRESALPQILDPNGVGPQQ